MALQDDKMYMLCSVSGARKTKSAAHPQKKKPSGEDKRRHPQKSTSSASVVLFAALFL